MSMNGSKEKQEGIRTTIMGEIRVDKYMRCVVVSLLFSRSCLFFLSLPHIFSFISNSSIVIFQIVNTKMSKSVPPRTNHGQFVVFFAFNISFTFLFTTIIKAKLMTKATKETDFSSIVTQVSKPDENNRTIQLNNPIILPGTSINSNSKRIQ